MQPIIQTHPQISLVGKSEEMSFADNRTFALWSGFMPRRKEISNSIGEDLYSVQCYPGNFDFNPTISFKKWAAVAVSYVNDIPEGMETLTIPEGLYAVFLYKGKNTEAESFFRYVFMEWLPASDYKLDSRPHFEILGNKYKHNDTDSEEEIWIPVKQK